MYWIYLWFVRGTTEIEKKKLRKKNSFDTQSIVGISLFALFTIRSSAIQQTKKKVRKAYRFPISFMLFSNIFTIGLTMLTVGVTNHIRCFLIFFCHSFSMLLCLLDRFFLLFYVFFLYKKCVCRCLSKWFLYVNVIFCSRWKYEKTTTKIINKKYWKWFAKFYLKKKIQYLTHITMIHDGLIEYVHSAERTLKHLNDVLNWKWEENTFLLVYCIDKISSDFGIP